MDPSRHWHVVTWLAGLLMVVQLFGAELLHGQQLALNVRGA
jgi:hypothetical protein